MQHLRLFSSSKRWLTGALLRLAGSRTGVAAETAVLMASPSETTLILLGAGAAAGLINPPAAAFWLMVTALGLTITPLLAKLGRLTARSVDRHEAETVEEGAASGKTVIFGFGRVGQMVADMLVIHGRSYLAVENDIDIVLSARAEGYTVLYGDVARRTLVERLKVGQAEALVMTMDDPVLVVRLTRTLRNECPPELPIIARARDTDHAARLYRAGVTDAVPETLEASLQLSEAVLVDIGLAMGPVIASIHEKRSELRAEIMESGNLSEEPSLGCAGRGTARRNFRQGSRNDAKHLWFALALGWRRRKRPGARSDALFEGRTESVEPSRSPCRSPFGAGPSARVRSCRTARCTWSNGSRTRASCRKNGDGGSARSAPGVIRGQCQRRRGRSRWRRLAAATGSASGWKAASPSNNG